MKTVQSTTDVAGDRSTACGGSASFLSEGLVCWRGQLWALGKLRKKAKCKITGEPIAGKAWRPINHGMNRWERVSEGGMRQAMTQNDEVRQRRS